MTITLSISVHRTDNRRGMNGLALSNEKKNFRLKWHGCTNEILNEFRHFGLFKGPRHSNT